MRPTQLLAVLVLTSDPEIGTYAWHSIRYVSLICRGSHCAREPVDVSSRDFSTELVEGGPIPRAQDFVLLKISSPSAKIDRRSKYGPAYDSDMIPSS